MKTRFLFHFAILSFAFCGPIFSLTAEEWVKTLCLQLDCNEDERAAVAEFVSTNLHKIEALDMQNNADRINFSLPPEMIAEQRVARIHYEIRKTLWAMGGTEAARVRLIYNLGRILVFNPPIAPCQLSFHFMRPPPTMER